MSAGEYLCSFIFGMSSLEDVCSVKSELTYDEDYLGLPDLPDKGPQVSSISRRRIWTSIHPGKV